MSALTVIVPILPPTVNHMYIATRDGGKALSDQAQAFRKLAGYEARITANTIGWTVPQGRLRLTIALTFGDRRNQDIDNRAKAGIDALALALGFDDSRIDELVIRRAGYDKGRPLCEMILEPL